MGNIVVHEFTTLDRVIDAPTWTFDFGFDPKMGTAIAEIMGGCKGLLLGRRTFEMFAPAWSARTAADDPGAPFMNESPKYVVGSPSPHKCKRAHLVAVKDRSIATDGECDRFFGRFAHE